MSGGDLDIPESGGWARSPAKVVADPAWRRRERRRPRWLPWLGGLAAASLLGAAVMALLDEGPAHPGEVPLITADPTPVRVRPEDPGGMQVPNLDKAVYDQVARSAAPRGTVQAAAPRVETLLPPPEAPRPVPVPPPVVAAAPPPALIAEPASLSEGPPPSALAREVEEPRERPTPGRALPPPEPPRAQPTQTQPAQAQPAQAQPAQAQPAQAPAPPAPPPAGTGRIQVQLAAVSSERAASQEWDRLRRRMPDLLANQRLVVTRGEREGQPFWRVRTGAFEDNAAARAFCERVKARGGSCFVAPSG